MLAETLYLKLWKFTRWKFFLIRYSRKNFIRVQDKFWGITPQQPW
jgi:hypothetical protein